MPATFKTAAPYQGDVLDLPVANLETALPFYQTVMGFHIQSRSDKSAVLTRDNIQFGLAENGGDPEQNGCFFEVDDIEKAFAELKTNGLNQTEPNYRTDQHGETTYKVFFIIAPDGLCYCLGQRQI